MPGALVADEMGLGKTFILVAVAVLCKLVTECYGGILSPSFNTTFNRLNTAAYRISFFPRLILRLNLLPVLQEQSLCSMLGLLLRPLTLPNQTNANSRLRCRRKLYLPVEQPLLGIYLEG
jgi:hypothetical protein